jgi:hypothetical protein
LKVIVSSATTDPSMERSTLAQPASHSSTSTSGRAAGGDPERDAPSTSAKVEVAPRCTITARGQPARSATSTSRSELEELGAPTTTISSTRGAMAFTAACRLVVA